MRYQELIQEINKGIYHPVYLFTGPEQYIAGMMEKRVISSAVPESLAQLNVMTFFDQETNIADVIAICQQLPMMSERRIVVLKEETGLTHSSDQTVIDTLCAYVENPEPSTSLIIYDIAPDKRKKIWKTLSKTATVVDYQKLTESELEKWIARRLKLAGKQIKRSIVERFIQDTAYLQNETQTMERVDNELEKIISYVGDKSEITVQDLETVLPKSIDDNIYHMMDSVMTGEMGTALEMLNNFYLEGESPFSIFGLLISQLRTMLHIQCLKEKHMPDAAIAKAVGRPPFVVKKIQNTLRRFSKTHLIQLIEDAATLDVQMKTGIIEPESGLTLYILKMQK